MIRWMPGRVRPGGFFVWPLMAMLWGFDVEAVARCSRVVSWIEGCESVRDCHLALYAGRAELGDALRDVEDLPRQRDMEPPRRR